MESIIATAVTGVLTLVGVLVSNSRSRAVMEVKIDELSSRVEKRNHMIERTYALETRCSVIMVDEGGSADTYAGEAGVGVVDVEFEGGSLGPNGWFTKNMSGGKLIGLTVYYDTPHPGDTGYYEACYRVHWLGPSPAWGKWEHDDDGGGAGNDRDQIDMIELTIAPC